MARPSTTIWREVRAAALALAPRRIRRPFSDRTRAAMSASKHVPRTDPRWPLYYHYYLDRLAADRAFRARLAEVEATVSAAGTDGEARSTPLPIAS